MLHMVAGAKAFVVITDFHDADGIGGVVGKALHVETVLHFFLGGVFDGDWQVFLYHLVNAVFD